MTRCEGSHITEGAFQQVGIAIAVAKGKPESLAAVTEFMDAAKREGIVRKALDYAGYADITVAMQ
jgi:polar amino acid transport system substrate-binding protein